MRRELHNNHQIAILQFLSPNCSGVSKTVHVVTHIRSPSYIHHLCCNILYKNMQILMKFLFSSVVDQSCPECQLKVVVPDQIADWENLGKSKRSPEKSIKNWDLRKRINFYQVFEGLEMLILHLQFVPLLCMKPERHCRRTPEILKELQRVFSASICTDIMNYFRLLLCCSSAAICRIHTKSGEL